MWQKKTQHLFETKLSTTERFLGRRAFLAGWVQELKDVGDGYFVARVRGEQEAYACAVDLFTEDMRCDCTEGRNGQHCQHQGALLCAIKAYLKDKRLEEEGVWSPLALRTLSPEALYAFVAAYAEHDANLRGALSRHFPPEEGVQRALGCVHEMKRILAGSEVRGGDGYTVKEIIPGEVRAALEDLEEGKTAGSFKGMQVLLSGLLEMADSKANGAILRASVEEVLGELCSMAFSTHMEKELVWVLTDELSKGHMPEVLAPAIRAVAHADKGCGSMIVCSLQGQAELSLEGKRLLVQLLAEQGQEAYALEVLREIPETPEVLGIQARLLAAGGYTRQAYGVLQDAYFLARDDENSVGALQQIEVDWKLHLDVLKQG